MKQYKVNEIFYSPQGEGARAGEMSVFIRFSGCNMKCEIARGPLSPGGFDCDTEFVSGTKMTAPQIVDFTKGLLSEGARNALERSGLWVVLTGGEPGLQVDKDLVDHLHDHKFKVAIETNGTIPLDQLGLDYIACSPKVAEHSVRCLEADEVRYVRAYGQAIPVPKCKAKYKYISPAFTDRGMLTDTFDWCMKLIESNPDWRLSIQSHKLMKVR